VSPKQITQKAKDEIALQLTRRGVDLPDGAWLFAINGKPYVYIFDMDKGMSIHVRGELKGVSVLYGPESKPPVKLVIPWGLHNEPATIAQLELARMAGVQQSAFTGFGANVKTPCFALTVKRGTKRKVVESALSQVLRSLETRQIYAMIMDLTYL
jgi:hypothetical protein